jgi:RHS repeat-associated protein
MRSCPGNLRASCPISSSFVIFLMVVFGIYSRPLEAQQTSDASQILNPSTLIGDQPYTTLKSDAESIDNANGGVNVSVPLIHLPGINGFDLDLKVNYSSKLYDLSGFVVNPSQPGTQPIYPTSVVLDWANNLSALRDFAGGQLSIPRLMFGNQFYQYDIDTNGAYHAVYCATNWTYIDETGAMHPFDNREDCSPYTSESWVTHTSDTHDNSFMHLDTTNLSDVKVYLKNGNIVHFSEPVSTDGGSLPILTVPSFYPSYIQDPNGNEIKFNLTSNDLTITDSVGRSVILNRVASPVSLQYNASDGKQHFITTTSVPVAGTDVTLHATSCEGPTGSTGLQVIPSTIDDDLGSTSTQNNIVLDSGGTSQRTFTVTLDGAQEPVKVSYPSGGYTQYTYQALTGVYQGGRFHCGNYDIREISQKLVCKSSSGSCSSPDTTTFTPSIDAIFQASNTGMSVVEPADTAGRQRKTVYGYSVTEGDGFAGAREISRSVYDNQSTLLNSVTTTYTNGPSGIPLASGVPYALWSLPKAVTTTTPTASGSLVSTVNYQTYDTVTLTNAAYLGPYSYYVDNPTSITQSDYSGNIIKTTTNAWNYLGTRTWDRLASATISDGSTSSETSYGYDGNGNVTSVTVSGTNAPTLTTGYTVNSYGQIVKITDPKGNITSYDYANAWSDSACPVTSATANGPGLITDALNHQTTIKYYSCSGHAANVKDANSQETSYTYDGLNRTFGITYPDGGNTSYTYTDTAPNTLLTTKKMSASGTPGPYKVETIYDGLGRVLQSQLQSDPAGTVYTDAVYDALGRVSSGSNPYRSTADATYGTTQYLYDALDRKIEQTDPDGAASHTCYNGISTLSTGKSSCAVHVATQSGEWADRSDESGSDWQDTYDALGRLTNVVEPGSRQTVYTYDVLNNLLNVNQKGVSGETPRTRSFSYDALSRLLSATNPETGTISYQYATNGALCAGDVSLPCSKTDGRGIKASYIYDVLNRLTQKSFSDGTSPIVYEYDTSSIGFSPSPADASRNLKATLSNPIGRLSAACQTPGSTCDAFSYDSMGRVVQQWTSLPGYNINGEPVYSRQAAYDLAGNVTSLTYPDGRVVTQGWDAGGHQQTSTFSSWNGQNAGSTYLSRATYWPSGAVQNMFYGNGVGTGRSMNNRLQVDEIGEVQLSGGQSYNLFVKVYCHGPATAPLSSTIPGCDAIASANNGNVWEVKDALNSSQSQTYTYDSLNRITSFSLGGRLSQQYGLDSFGNMGIVMAGVQTSTFDPATNRISNLPCANTEAPYDGAGNQFCDTGQDGTVRQIAYDANNQISQIATAGNTSHPFVVYDYDGNGNRVRKNNADGTFTEYLYFNGQPIAERNADGTWSDYIYANGQKIAKADDYDVRIHLSGTNCSNCGSNPNMFSGTTSLTAANGYTIRSGDVLSWRQYQDGSALGGLITSFTDGSTANGVALDTDGQLINADTTKNTWHQRQVDLSAYAGKTLILIDPFDWTAAPAGAWDIYYADISLTSTDGTVIPLYNGSMMTLSLATNPTVSNPTAVTERVANGNTETSTVSNITTNYYLQDTLGTTQTELSSSGWPVWQGQFTPFGMEIDTLLTPMHYKFTGKERDSESGNDYFGSRYYTSNMGRWMSPDWSAKAEAIPYAKLTDPQSLNLYSYVGNNPLGRADKDGHCCSSSDDDTGLTDSMAGTPFEGHGTAVMAVMLSPLALEATAVGVRSSIGFVSRAAMSAYLGMSVLGTQMGQDLTSARDNVSGALNAIKDAASSGEISMPGGTANLVKSSINSVTNNFTNSDINGAIKQSVTGIEAGGDHVQELQGVGNSLTSLSERLSTALNNPTLSGQTRALYQNAVKAIQPAVDQINKLKTSNRPN